MAAAKARSKRPQSLLILHLDAAKLREDELHLGAQADLAAKIAAITTGSSVTIEETTTLDSLHRLLASFMSARRTFDVIVVIGHSNEEGIRIAEDRPNGFVAWESFARYLKPFRPRRLLLVACRAGRADAGEALFDANRTLRRIYACPVNATKDFANLMLLAVPYVVANRTPKDAHVLFGQFVSLLAAGAQLREWRRTEDHGNPDSVVFDQLADLADPLTRRIHGALRAMLPVSVR